jgi:hypothetical protein
MRWSSKILFSVLCIVLVSISAKADICEDRSVEKTDQARAEQLKLEAAEKAARDSWVVKMFPVKNLEYNHNYGALCIFRVEVVPQMALKMVQVRAPREMMPAIEEALKTLDVPSPTLPPPYKARGVEITAYVLVAAERAVDPGWMPIPKELERVAAQIKTLLPNETLFLADTVIARGMERSAIGINGATSFQASSVSIRDNPEVISLNNLNVSSNGGAFTTTIEVPVGTQVVVGKASSTLAPRKAVVLVLTGKIL